MQQLSIVQHIQYLELLSAAPIGADIGNLVDPSVHRWERPPVFLDVIEGVQSDQFGPTSQISSAPLIGSGPTAHLRVSLTSPS